VATVVVGIDPGTEGALCKMAGGEVVGSMMMPSADSMKAACDFISSEPAADYVFIERVHSWSGQGVKSTWTFAFITGAVFAAASMVCSDVVIVEPKAWRAFFGIQGSKNKREAKEAVVSWATEKFPGAVTMAKPKAKRMPSGVADSIAIASFGESTIATKDSGGA